MDLPQAEQWGRAITGLRPRQIGALPLVYPILTALHVRQTTNDLAPSQADIDLGRIVELLTLNRLMAPQPLYHVADWLGETVLPQELGIAPEKVYDNRLGRALDQLHPHLGELWVRLVSRAIQVYDLDLSVLHWDVTSLYFEGAYTDSELATYGYSRDHRPDTKQVNLEVDVSHDGYVPVLYQVLPGNTADITRPLPHLHNLLRFLARPELADRRFRPILVSDRKMVTPEAVLACHDRHLFYLGPLANGTATEAVLRSVSVEELAARPLAYRPQRVKPDDARFVPYQGVWRPFTFEHGGQPGRRAAGQRGPGLGRYPPDRRGCGPGPQLPHQPRAPGRRPGLGWALCAGHQCDSSQCQPDADPVQRPRWGREALSRGQRTAASAPSLCAQRPPD